MQHILPIFCSKFATELGQIWVKSFNIAASKFLLNLVLNFYKILAFILKFKYNFAQFWYVVLATIKKKLKILNFLNLLSNLRNLKFKLSNLMQISFQLYSRWVLKNLFISNLKYLSIKNRPNFSNHLQKASQ
jgi:hypothetical protein